MSVTITIRKLHLAVAVLVVAVLAPATAAVASHVFDDVVDGAFYADAVQWAAANDITQGRTADVFDPNAGVTRGENVTFAYRYDTNVAQPAFTALERAQPFAVTAHASRSLTLSATPTATVAVSVTAPSDGHVTVNSTARAVHNGADGSQVWCAITERTAVPTSFMGTEESLQLFEKQGAADTESLSGTRTFEIAAGSTVDYVLACREGNDRGRVITRNLTAIFTPAP